uniref:RRM domain-containing protein n=1 Tax=Neogobius melanostomus TaxID=47308 RepID=A0A8C6V1L0_9GOBI
FGAPPLCVGGGVGRGRGRGGQGVEPSPNGPATISIEGLSSSTTEAQLKNLLKSVGPIEMFKMIPQHRKAIARFSSPQHAASFQTSFHRHMIDLSHIDVSLIDG